MSYEVLLSPEAIRDLQEIHRYIAAELQSPQNAAAQLARLEQRIYALNELPLRHRVYDREPWRSRGLRVMPVDNYLVFYISEQSKKTVTVLRVMYGRRDVAAHLILPE